MNSKDQAAIAQASNNDNVRILTLDEPIKRGESEITEITIRKPYGDALTGISLAKLLNDMDHDTCVKLIPRVTTPQISALDIKNGTLSPFDLTAVMGEIASFFMSKASRAKLSQTE